MADLVITSTKGGLNNSDPPLSLLPEQCTEATNVEWVRSALGERRRGAYGISLSGSAIPTYAFVTFLHRHTGGASEGDDTLWVLGLDGSVGRFVYKDTTWHPVTPVDAVTVTGTYKYKLRAQSLHGKLFIAYKSAVDRLHVWDGTTLRRVGIKAATAAPTGADSGTPGTVFTGTRHYRVRFTRQESGVTKLRSEPSPVLTHVPSGTNTGVTVTRPTAPGESETHWELEASLDNDPENFYRIATTILATTTAVDTTAYATGYAASFTLSETIGDYSLVPSARFIVADQDRPVFAGSFEDDNLSATVSWGVVASDTTGVGNDERIPTETVNTLNLDSRVGGGLTGLSNPINGYIYAFKLNHIYKLVRTGERFRAYEAVLLTDKRGALEGSVMEGVDQYGKPCLYFIDPKVGPCRLGQGGLQTCGRDIERTWKRVNIDASVPVVSLFYPTNAQAHFWLATDEITPDTHIVLHVRHTIETTDGVRQGWAIWTGASRFVLAATLFAQNIDDGVSRSKVLAPFVSIGVGT